MQNRTIMAYEGADGTFPSTYLSCSSTPKLLIHAYREARENAEMTRFRAENPKLQQQFADLKRGLSQVSDAEWDNIPEVGNLTRRKRRKEERAFAVPDSVLVGDRGKGEYDSALDPMQQEVRFLLLSRKRRS